MPRARLFLLSGTAAAALACAAPAQAGCSIATTPVAFGTYNPQSGAALNGVGSVTTVCDNATANPNVTVTIDGGGSGNVNNRAMSSGTDTLGYQLYSDATRTTIWGTGTAGLRYNARNRTVTNTIYGRIPGAQNVAAGLYTDTLIVTVTF